MSTKEGKGRWEECCTFRAPEAGVDSFPVKPPAAPKSLAPSGTEQANITPPQITEEHCGVPVATKNVLASYEGVHIQDIPRPNRVFSHSG